MNDTITIGGDRQSGKTHAALAVAASDALAGRHVLFTSGSHIESTEAVRRASRMMSAADVTKVALSAGNQRIETRGGGRIYFVTRYGSAGRGVSVDTLILDEWDGNQRHMEDLIPATNTSSDPRIVIAPKADR